MITRENYSQHLYGNKLMKRLDNAYIIANQMSAVYQQA